MVNTWKGGGIDLPANNHRRRTVNQPQPEMNPPPTRTDRVAAAQMQLLQQMANTMTEMQAQMRQECQEMRHERHEIRQEMRQKHQEIRQVWQEQQQL
jgi:FtsZ-binding cell division protein ZapB